MYLDAALTNPVSTGVLSTTLTSVPLYFEPDADFNGIVDFEFAAIDNDGVQDATPGTTTIDVAAINDAPDLDIAGTMTLASITEDNVANGGSLVSDIILSAGGNRITDVDGTAIPKASRSLVSVLATTSGSTRLMSDRHGPR